MHIWLRVRSFRLQQSPALVPSRHCSRAERVWINPIFQVQVSTPLPLEKKEKKNLHIRESDVFTPPEASAPPEPRSQQVTSASVPQLKTPSSKWIFNSSQELTGLIKQSVHPVAASMATNMRVNAKTCKTLHPVQVPITLDYIITLLLYFIFTFKPTVSIFYLFSTHAVVRITMFLFITRSFLPSGPKLTASTGQIMLFKKHTNI